MNTTQLIEFVSTFWDRDGLTGLSEFIRIPAKSPLYDPAWDSNRNLFTAASMMADFANKQNIPGLTSKILQLPGKSPLLYIEIPGTAQGNTNTTLLYGHLDKMPETEGWAPETGPWIPVLKNDRLYGRGSVDDGYAFFAYIAAIKALHTQNIPFGRCVLLIEGSEESNSEDFAEYLKEYSQLIGKPNLVVCFDSGCYDYDNLWCTTSLRGIIEGTLEVALLTEGVHSGTASGIIPSTFRIIRMLLDRIEDVRTGKVLLDSCNTKIPSARKKQTKVTAKILGDSVYKNFPLLPGAKPADNNIYELLLNRNWRPTLSIIGAEGLPSIQEAGTVLRPKTALQLSIRIPPYCDPVRVIKELQQTFTTNPPYGAHVKFTPVAPAAGWDMPKMDDSLAKTIEHAAKTYFGGAALYSGEGGSIGVIQLLSDAFPQAQVLVSGLCGPGSNEHGPNESLYLPAAKKITCCLAEIIAKQA